MDKPTYRWDGSPINHGPVTTLEYEGFLYGTMADNTQVLVIKGNYFSIFYNEIRKLLGFVGYQSHYWGNLIFIPTGGNPISKLSLKSKTNASSDDKSKIQAFLSFRSLIGDGAGSNSKSFMFRMHDEIYDITLCTQKDTNKEELSVRVAAFLKGSTAEDIIKKTIRNKYGNMNNVKLFAQLEKSITDIIKTISKSNIDIKYELLSSQDYIRNNIYDILL
jgi:hypothetical protein